MSSLISSSTETAARTVLVGNAASGSLRLHRRRRRDSLLARLRAGSLDRRLAGGEPAESDTLLAVRASMLVTPSARRTLARDLADLADRGRRRSRHQVPVARRRVDEAAGDIAELVDLLRSDRPVAAGGVAAARLLLTSAASPAFGVLRHVDGLTAAVRESLERAS